MPTFPMVLVRVLFSDEFFLLCFPEAYNSVEDASELYTGYMQSQIFVLDIRGFICTSRFFSKWICKLSRKQSGQAGTSALIKITPFFVAHYAG